MVERTASADEATAPVPLEALLRSLPDAVLVAEPDGRIVARNDAAAAAGADNLADALGEEVAAWLGGGQEASVVRGTLAGNAVEVSLSRQNVPQPFVVAVCRDTTERQKAEEADRLAFERLLEIQQLRETNRFKAQVLNAASHELNTPITPVKIQLHLLASAALGPLTEGQAHALRMLKRNVDRLATLVEAVLDVGRIESGRFRVAADEIDVATLAEGVAEEHGIALDADPCPLVGDAHRIKQLLRHLAENAATATEDGGHARMVVRPGFVEVSDTGRGFTDAERAKLFRPFEQDTDGAGLGLYLARAIAQAHGGTLTAHSDGEGKGCTVSVTLRGASE